MRLQPHLYENDSNTGVDYLSFVIDYEVKHIKKINPVNPGLRRQGRFLKTFGVSVRLG